MSSLQGYITTNYYDLETVFGSPNEGPNGDIDGKVTCEWVVYVGNMEIRIYDWKTRRTPFNTYEWHIGGNSHDAVTAVERVMNSCLGVRHSVEKLRNYA